jgi:hypothetical protein
LANQEHLDILKQGKEVWNQWREAHRNIRPDLSGADLFFLVTNFRHINFENSNLSNSVLDSIDLTYANLEYANLSGASLIAAQLNRANFFGANLSEADLREAELVEAYLPFSNLNRADLSRACLSDAELHKADLREANLSEAILIGANLKSANLSGANLNGADLSRSTLVETDLTIANLTDCKIYGISAWNIQIEGAKQDSLIITPEDEPTIKVDNLEVAQFIYLLLNHKKLRNVLNAVTERGVLILGRFGGDGLGVLQAIAARLREENYLPIIFDFERPQDRNYTETVKTLAGLARFVIADLSGPSVPQELYATVPHFKIPFVPIIEASRKPYSMAVDILEYPWVVRPPVTFATIEELLEQLPTKVIAPAEEKYQARQKLLDELFKQV